MRIFIFKSESNDGLRAFCVDGGGRTLPTQHGPWEAIGIVRPEANPPYGLPRRDIEVAINEHGFQLWRMKPKPTES